MQAERATGTHHVGYRVGDPELHRNLDGAVEPDHRGINPTSCQVFSHQIGKRGGNPLARKVLDTPGSPRGRRIAEARRPEAEREPLMNWRVGFLREVATGDAEVELSRSDVDRNVLGSQKEEFDIVDGIDDGQVLGISSPPVASFRQDLGGRLGQRALVGYGDPQHAVHSLAYTSSRVRPREIISTCAQYSNWLISPASSSSPSCSAANHTSPASSRIFLPSPCTPPSRAATVPLPAGLVRARSLSSANSASKVFTGRDCVTAPRAKSRQFRRGRCGQVAALGAAWCRISPCMSSSETPLVSITH